MGEYTYLIIIAGVGCFQAISVAIIGGLFAKETKKRKCDHEQIENQVKSNHEKIEKRAKVRAKESLLAMKLMSANNALTIANSHAIIEGRTNGEMTGALGVAKDTQKEYYEFINSVASEHISYD